MTEPRPWPHPPMPPSHPAGRYAPSFYRVPWLDGQPEPSHLQPPAGSLRWSLQGVDLPSPPHRLHHHS
jgi:hypothetical protein